MADRNDPSRGRSGLHELLPPEYWDAIFKPRGPFGLLSGRTVLDAIPGVSQGLAYQDYQQASREGDGIGRILAGAGMLPGGGFFKGMRGPIRKIAGKLDDVAPRGGEDALKGVVVDYNGEKFRFPPGTDPVEAERTLWNKVTGPRARGQEEVVDNYPSELPSEEMIDSMSEMELRSFLKEFINNIVPFPKKPK